MQSRAMVLVCEYAFEHKGRAPQADLAATSRNATPGPSLNVHLSNIGAINVLFIP